MALTRSVLLGVAGCGLAVLASQVFNGRALELLLVPVVVTVAAIMSSRFGLVAQIAATAGATVVTMVATVFIAGGTWGDVVPGVFRGPRRLLSTEWPSPLEPSIVATLALFVGACTGIALVLASRRRWRLLPLLPILVGATVLLALSAPEPPPGWVLIGLGLTSIAFALTDRVGAKQSRGLRVDRTVVATVVAVAVATGLMATAVAWADRADPRSTEVPDASEILLDPLESTVAMRKAEPVVDLMTITDRSPLARPTMPARWRLVAFDAYDGQRWVPTIELSPIGGVLGAVPADDSSVLVYGVSYHGDWIDLVPFPGQPISVDRDVQTDAGRVAVRLSEPPDASTTIVARAIPEPSFGDLDGVGTAERPVDEISATLTEQARRLAGDGSPTSRLGRLAQTMRTDWELDSDAPGAGLQQALVSRFVTDTRRGTREQFVSAFALLARSIGFNARVAAGFIVPPDELGSTFTLRTDQAAIWPEVRLSDGTWLAFDPVPDNEVVDNEQIEPTPQAQTPAAAQPPIVPPSDDEANDDEVVLDEESEAAGWGTLAVWAARISAGIGVVLAPILLAVVAVLWLKWRRRRSRLRASEPGIRVRGAWANATDSLVDAGMSISPSWTDDHIASAAASVVVGLPHEARRLAAMSSAVTFGSRSRDEASRLAVDATTTSASIDDSIRSSRTRWERIKWRLSLRSLRRGSRSPVVP